MRALMQQAKWAEARTAIHRLLDEHSERISVQAREDSIVADYRLCAFWCETSVPKAAELIGPALVSWAPTSSKVKLRYDSSSLSSWDKGEEELWVHPAVFAGPYTISVTAIAYPRRKGSPSRRWCALTRVRSSSCSTRSRSSRCRDHEWRTGRSGSTSGRSPRSCSKARLPAWLFEVPELEKRTPRFEFTGAKARSSAAKAALAGLEALVYGSHRDFYANAHLRYPQAWGLVHFLRKSSPANQKSFATLWQELRSGSVGTRGALDKAFAGVDWAKLELEYCAHLEKAPR